MPTTEERSGSPVAAEPDLSPDIAAKLDSPTRRRWLHLRRKKRAKVDQRLLPASEDEAEEIDETVFFCDEDELAARSNVVRTHVAPKLQAIIRRRMARGQRRSEDLTPVQTPASSSTPLLERQPSTLTDVTTDDEDADTTNSLALAHPNSAVKRKRSLFHRPTKRYTKDRDRLKRTNTADYVHQLPHRFTAKWAAARRPDATEAEQDAAMLAAIEVGLARGTSEVIRLRETEELWENQRGFVFFGRLKFTANARLPGDVVQWTKPDQTPSPYSKQTVPLPDPRWEWSTSWLIDMNRACDAQGWQYNIVFRTTGWHAYPHARHSFVRRRRWVRERRIAHPGSAAAAQAPDTSTDVNAPGMTRENTASTVTTTESPSTAVLPHNSAFADPKTPQAEPQQVTAGPPPDLETLLPALDPTKALDLLGWEQPLPARWPFTCYARVRREEACAHREDESRSDAELHGVWRDAVVECNYRRVARVMGACHVDRTRVDFVRTWVEDGPADEVEGSSEDLWNVFEARLDAILSLFEYQAARSTVLQLLVDHHRSQHAHHRHHSWDRHGLPDELSPLPDRHTPSQRAGPRMQFWHDLEQLQRAYDEEEKI